MCPSSRLVNRQHRENIFANQLCVCDALLQLQLRNTAFEMELMVEDASVSLALGCQSAMVSVFDLTTQRVQPTLSLASAADDTAQSEGLIEQSFWHPIQPSLR